MFTRIRTFLKNAYFLIGDSCERDLNRCGKQFQNYAVTVTEFTGCVWRQWIEPPPDFWNVIGSNPVGDSDFFLCPTLVKC